MSSKSRELAMRPGAGEQHLAVTMAQRAGVATRGETDIAILKNAKKSMVYRIVVGGQDAFIAKRASKASLAVEICIYTEVLPSLPPEHRLRCLGMREDVDPAYIWIFLEDAGNEAFDRNDPSHRAAFGRLLGSLHATQPEPMQHAAIPRRVPADYLMNLAAARDRINTAVAHDIVPKDDVAPLDLVVAQLTRLERRWSVVEQELQRDRVVLTHSDIQPRNIRLLPGTSDAPRVVLLDWELAAWDSAAIDLKSIESLDDPLLRGYLDASGGQLGADGGRMLRLAQLGLVLRFVHATDWATSHLKTSRPQRGVERLAGYAPALSEALDRIGI